MRETEKRVSPRLFRSPDGAHLGQLVDGLVAVVDVVLEEGGELVEAEYLERAAGRDLADGRGQELVDVVAVAGLHEDGRVGEARREDLLRVVVEDEADALPDVPPRALDRRVAVDVAELAQTEAVVVLRGRIREAVDVDV